MLVLRTVCESDLAQVHRLAVLCGKGMTSLPQDKDLLQKRIALSLESFKKQVHEPSDEYYLFVLEDTKSQQLIGTSAIQAKTGFDTPFYSYHLSKYARISYSLNIRSEYELLNLVNDNQGRTEICTLFLDPSYRKSHNGLLLSKARFLFMAQHQQRFAPAIIAELRGLINKNNQSPFWEHVGRHFFQMDFNEADSLNLSTNKQFIEDLMPQYPIYVPLLAEEAQKAIGKPHESTIPAMSILIKEGFHFNNYVHIFDAGPILEALLTDIKTVALSQEYSISGISDEVRSIEFIVANTQIDFRATICSALIHEDENSCILSKKTAESLQVRVKDTVRISPLYLNNPHKNL